MRPEPDGLTLRTRHGARREAGHGDEHEPRPSVVTERQVRQRTPLREPAMKKPTNATDRPAAGSVPMASTVIGSLRGYLRTRHTVRGLLRFSDRDLEDLQLTRAELVLIARRYFCN